MSRKMKEVWKNKNCKIATFCLIAGIMGLTGMYFFSGETGNEPKENQIAEQSVKQPDIVDNNKELAKESDTENVEETQDVAVVLKPKPAAEDKTKNTEKKENEQNKQEKKTMQNTETVELNFNKESRLIPPVNGEVIMDYSMDKSIYFKTLDQYKYNPAQIIAAKEGAEVITAADGQVLEVKNDVETGLTVIMDIGNDYKLVYGQLKEVMFCPGDKVKAGELLGYVTQPTKYYISEGSNLFFQLWEGDHTLNPADYIQDLQNQE